jgi:hypothetical protein
MKMLPKLEWNSDNHKDTVISSDALERALKLMQNGKCSELYKYTPEEFKMRLLQFLNNTYTKNCTQNE